jgi:heptaprenyl diphosphate synthase
LRNTRKLVTLALFISVALVLHVIEGMLPVLPGMVPGIKLGLANLVTLIAIMFFGFKDVLLIVVLRCFMGAVFAGAISNFLFSAAGGILSAVVMWFIYKKLGKFFSITGISTAGAIAFNIGQLFVASIIVKNFMIYSYLSALIISAVVTGIFIGIVCSYVKRLIINNINKLGLSFNEK